MVKIKKIIPVFFIAVFMNYYASVVLFSHTHIIHGATILHSHLHTDSHHNSKSGGHSEQSITLIAQISQFEYVSFACCNIPSPLLFLLHENKRVETDRRITSVHLQNPSQRAPPVWAI
jgi:hypothetical protein